MRSPDIINHLGGGGGGGRRISGGSIKFLGEQKGGSVVAESPKGGSLKILEGFRGEHSNLLGRCQTWGRITKVINSYEARGSLQ